MILSFSESGTFMPGGPSPKVWIIANSPPKTER